MDGGSINQAEGRFALMSNSGNYRVQSAAAREAGTGGASQQPDGGDKRVAIIGVALLAAGIAALILLF